MELSQQLLFQISLIFLYLTPPLSAISISDAPLFSCPAELSTPTLLPSFTGGKLVIHPTSSHGDLCILSRVDRNTTKKVYIPIARSYDSYDWHRVRGKYITQVTATCGNFTQDNRLDIALGTHTCEISVPDLVDGNVGYYLTSWEEKNVTDRRIAARFLERASWGGTWDEIVALETKVASLGSSALALWVKEQQAMDPSSHRKFFRERLNPRAVESYQYGIPGPKACEVNARFRRFAFTAKDMELSQGASGNVFGNTGLPFTPVKVETVGLGAERVWVVKFGDDVRTVLSNPLIYMENEVNVTVPDGDHTICHVEEVVGDRMGDIPFSYDGVQLQLLLGDDRCTSSFTDRGGVDDGKGDGAVGNEAVVDNKVARFEDRTVCKEKCADANKVKLILGGNPEVQVPNDFDMSSLSWIDLSSLNNTEIININTDRTHDSSWLLQKSLNTCKDQNGDEFPDPAGLSANDYSSVGRGKYNLDKPIFAKLPGNKWALHDFRTIFRRNTLDDPLADGGGATMKAAARNLNSETVEQGNHLVVRCLNTQRNILNEEQCRISYDENACTSVPLDENGKRNMFNPQGLREMIDKYLPAYAGHEGVVVCGSPNEIEPIPEEDDHFDLTNRKLQPTSVSYHSQKTTVFVEVVLGATDQLCQRLAFGLSKIFATSTTTNTDHANTETNIGVYDQFVTSCFSTYKDVIKKVSFNHEMSQQLTFLHSKSVAADWHKENKLAFPDENYARENLQLHSIGLMKLNEDGTPVLDSDGNYINNYEQKHIFTAAKIWTGMTESFRRGNVEELDRVTGSFLDPLQIGDVNDRDWFPKIKTGGGYIGDRYPLCSDLPERHFLKKGAKFRLLGGSSIPLSQQDPLTWEGNQEIQRMSLNRDSSLYKKLCNPTNVPSPASTLIAGTGIAQYDSTVMAPFCEGSSSSCDSVNLLAGRLSEVNRPNTIDGCSDGQDLSAEYNESVKRIVVSSAGGADLRGGDNVKIQATVISFHKQDRVDFYYTSNVTSPNWIYITTAAPKVGESILTVPYKNYPDIMFTLPKCLSPSGCRHAVRVVLRSSRNPEKPSRSTKRNDSYIKPNSNCPSVPFDDVDDIVFEVLPSPIPQLTCSFDTTVTLDSNLQCEGKECIVSTVRVVEVLPGVFYEYLQRPCVHLPFYNDAVKVFAGWNNNLNMCANKLLPSARSTCCGTYSDIDLYTPRWVGEVEWADVLSEYRGERLTFAQNKARCEDWGRYECHDPQRLGSMSQLSGQCLHRMSCADVVSGRDTHPSERAWLWTSSHCDIQVKVNHDGLIAIIHDPEQDFTAWDWDKYHPEVLGNVHQTKTVSFFYVDWNSNVAAGKKPFPHASDNGCMGGIISADACFCDTNVTTTAVFDSTPTRDMVLDSLHIGAFDPLEMFDNEYSTFVVNGLDDGVSVYRKLGYDTFSEHTIFRIKQGNAYVFLKNMEQQVSVCGGSFSFRNSPTFFDIADPQLLSAYHETDAYLDYVDMHDNTPPFVCNLLIQHFGVSNPSPDHVLGCSTAYKSGLFLFTWRDPNGKPESISFGSGSRGDLQAISASILLSDDVLSATLDSDPTFGGVKEPLHKLMQIMRSLEFRRSLTRQRTDGLIRGAQEAFGQAPYGIPDTFSFFSPDYMPFGAHIQSSLVSPESELLNMNYIIGGQNALYALIQDGLTTCNGGIGPLGKRGVVGWCGTLPEDVAGTLNFAVDEDSFGDTGAILQLSTLLTADRLSAANRAIIEEMYEATLTSRGKADALKVAQNLLVSTPEFHTTNKIEPLAEEREPSPSPGKDSNESYKAIIHLNLFGAMDSMNLLVPHPDDCPNLYDEYRAIRGEDLYLKPEELIKIDASTSDQPCPSFGINKYLGAEFASMYNEGEVAFIANIGHLQKPVTADNFLTETTTQLFSHFTMRDESFKVDAFNQRDNTGVMGRMTDILGRNTSSSRSAIDSTSKNLYGDPLVGSEVEVIPSGGPQKFFPNDIHDIKSVTLKLNNITAEGSGIHADLWSESFVKSYAQTDNYAEMLATLSDGPSYVEADQLGKQMEMITNFIRLNQVRGVKRDTFAVSWGGFDTHHNMKSDLHLKLDSLGILLKEFRDELINLNLWDGITVVVSSEMGRSITPNSSFGTDHGWGGHHMVIGGKVNGGRILGHHPHTYSPEWEYNTGRGVWIPTLPNEAMWLGVSQWFGIKERDDLSYVLPNMNNFGCRLYSETDIYRDGMGKLWGCGGDVIQLEQEIYLSEPRVLTANEQNCFCRMVTGSFTDIFTRCVILDQALSQRETNLFANRGLDYALLIKYEITSDSVGISDTITAILDGPEFQAAAEDMIDSCNGVTASPTNTPTEAPSKSPSIPPSSSPSLAPSTEPSAAPTSSPTSSSFPTFVGQTNSPSKSPTSYPTSGKVSTTSTSSTTTSSTAANPTSSPTYLPTAFEIPYSGQPVSIDTLTDFPTTEAPAVQFRTSSTAFTSTGTTTVSTTSKISNPTKSPTFETQSVTLDSVADTPTVVPEVQIGADPQSEAPTAKTETPTYMPTIDAPDSAASILGMTFVPAFLGLTITVFAHVR